LTTKEATLSELETIYVIEINHPSASQPFIFDTVKEAAEAEFRKQCRIFNEGRVKLSAFTFTECLRLHSNKWTREL
jgi:hypothetical protein